MLRARLVCLVCVLLTAACGDDGGDVPVDAGDDPGDEDAAIDAPSCDRTRANPCPLPYFPSSGNGDYYHGSGQIAARAEEVWTFVPPTTRSWRLSGTSSSGTLQFSISPDVSLVCSATGSYCLAGQPCSGVDVDLVAGTTYYVKACSQVDVGDIPYNVFMRAPQ